MSQKEIANVNRDLTNGQTIETIRRLLAVKRDMATGTVEDVTGSFTITKGNAPVNIKYAKPVKTEIATKAVMGSANTNENLQNSFLRSELNIMQGERRGIQVNQHNTNQVTTRKKPSNNSATTAERDALDRDMDAIASKLGMILKMLEPMSDSEKKNYLNKYCDTDSQTCSASFEQVQRRVATDFHAGTPSSATSQDVNHHPGRNNRKDCYQAIKMSMGKKQGVRSRREPDNQYAGEATAKNARKTDADATTFLRDQVSTLSGTGGENIPEFYIYGTSKVPSCYGWNVSRPRRNDPTSNFGERTTAPSTLPRTEAMENACIPSATKASDAGAPTLLGEQPTNPPEQSMLGATEVECIPRPAAASGDGACSIEPSRRELQGRVPPPIVQDLAGSNNDREPPVLVPVGPNTSIQDSIVGESNELPDKIAPVDLETSDDNVVCTTEVQRLAGASEAVEEDIDDGPPDLVSSDDDEPVRYIPTDPIRRKSRATDKSHDPDVLFGFKSNEQRELAAYKKSSVYFYEHIWYQLPLHEMHLWNQVCTVKFEPDPELQDCRAAKTSDQLILFIDPRHYVEQEIYEILRAAEDHDS